MEWKIKREDREFTAPDTATLQIWAREGHVIPTDYVLNPNLNRWMYAHELAELAGQFQAPESSSSVSASGCAVTIAFGLLGVMFFMWGAPVLGLPCFVGAVIALIVTMVKR